jgi:hypothetical protein
VLERNRATERTASVAPEQLLVSLVFAMVWLRCLARRGNHSLKSEIERDEKKKKKPLQNQF